MGNKSEIQVLVEVLESARLLTRFYISKLKDVDMKKAFAVDGNDINSPYWIVGHLVWSEQFLLIQALGGPDLHIPWLKHFGFGTKLQDSQNLPPIKEILDTWKQVHAKALEFLNTLSDDELDKPNPLGLNFAGDDSKRMMIHHFIRHEAIHSGHLGLICKMHGIKMV